MTVSYAVTVKPDGQRGDNSLANFVVRTGETPPPTCEPDDPTCTVNSVLSVSKSVTPASGSVVHAGDVLSYTLTFDNSIGTASAAVDYTDVMSGVVDDAVVSSAPAASDPALSTAVASDGQSFAITGSVSAGKTVTVSYAVTVKPDGQRGDNSLANFVVRTGETPPPTCEPDDPTCTVNSVLSVSKSVTPADGSAVKPGAELTYTITLDNAAGVTAASVAYVDDMQYALDDATLVSAPVSSSPDVTVTLAADGQSFAIDGSVAAGSVTTVTAKMTVKPYIQQGDGQIMNQVYAQGDSSDRLSPDDPQAWVDSPWATYNPVPDILVVKTGRIAAGAAGVAGDTMNWSFLIINTGPVDLGAVALTDHMSFVSDPNATCQWPGEPGVLSVGAQATCTATSVLTQADVDAGRVVNTVTATGTTFATPDPDPLLRTITPGTTVTSDSTSTVAVPQYPAIALVKSAVLPGGKSTAVAGDVVAYTMTASNPGDVTLTGVAVSDPLPGLSAINCQWPGATGVLVPGTHVACVATYVVTTADVKAGKLVNTAVVEGTGPDHPDLNHPGQTIPGATVTAHATATVITLVPVVKVSTGGTSVPSGAWVLAGMAGLAAVLVAPVPLLAGVVRRKRAAM